LRLSPLIAQKSPLDLNKIVEFASTSKDPLLVRKGLKVGDMLNELIDLKQVSPDDHYALLTEEISQELLHLGNLAEKVEKELNSLSIVYQAIQDHNDYLKSQLETYKAYLYNIRNQSSANISSKAKTLKAITPLKFTHQKLELEGVISTSNVPQNRFS
jgi:Ras GTPase-activating-like protein IQGAP2/3